MNSVTISTIYLLKLLLSCPFLHYQSLTDEAKANHTHQECGSSFRHVDVGPFLHDGNYTHRSQSPTQAFW